MMLACARHHDEPLLADVTDNFVSFVCFLFLWHVFGISRNRQGKDSDRVLVLPAPAEEKVGGIIIPDTAKEKPQRGKVVATGKGTKDEEMILKEGDTVLYGKYAGTEIEFDGTKYMMMRQSDVLAVVEE